MKKSIENGSYCQWTQNAETHHVNQDVQIAFPVLDQLCCIVFLALLFPLIFAKVALEGLFSPRCLQRIRNWSKSAATLILARIFKE